MTSKKAPAGDRGKKPYSRQPYNGSPDQSSGEYKHVSEIVAPVMAWIRANVKNVDAEADRWERLRDRRGP